MKRTPLKPRKQPMKRSGFTKPRKPMRRVSAKNWWEKLRPKVKVEFERAGITTCELTLAGCCHDNFLGFAHSLKRRNIKTEEEKREVILCCNVCHDFIERLPERRMWQIVKATIGARSATIVVK